MYIYNSVYMCIYTCVHTGEHAEIHVPGYSGDAETKYDRNVKLQKFIEIRSWCIKRY